MLWRLAVVWGIWILPCICLPVLFLVPVGITLWVILGDEWE